MKRLTAATSSLAVVLTFQAAFHPDKHAHIELPEHRQTPAVSGVAVPGANVSGNTVIAVPAGALTVTGQALQALTS